MDTHSAAGHSPATGHVPIPETYRVGAYMAVPLTGSHGVAGAVYQTRTKQRPRWLGMVPTLDAAKAWADRLHAAATATTQRLPAIGGAR